jgi:ribosomal protein L11 methyltransferase
MTVEPRYPYVAVDVAEDEADAASSELFDLGAQGVEQRDATTLRRGADGRTTLVASFEHEREARLALEHLRAEWSPRLEEVVGDAWRDEWKKHFEPFRICDGVVVRPPWRQYEPRTGEQVIELEPGRAFGTGLHETTSLIAEILADNAGHLRGSPVLDVGTGSGILSLVALALGATTARAIDVDPDAVLVTRENAERNGLAGRVEADGAPLATIAAPYPYVMANIDARTLVELAPLLAKRVAAGGRLVLSGILTPEASPAQLEDVKAAYAAFRVEEVRRKGEWIAMALRP